MSHLRISPRHLGQMKLGNFCPRCFWYQLQMNFKMPFDRPMPGIMYNLDHFEKAIVGAHFQSKGHAPKWLDPLGCKAPVEYPAKMTEEFPDLDITLVGMPDAVFSNDKGNLVLIDYKTAGFKGSEDPFMPTYETQLLGYAHLLESNEVGKVDSAALVYFQNEAKANQDDPLKLLTADGFTLPFEVKIHMVDLDMLALDPLLEQIREYADLPNPPEGLIKCKDCSRLQLLLDADEKLRDFQDALRRKNQFYRQVYHPRVEAERLRARKAGTGIDDDSPFVDLFFQDSVPAAWDIYSFPSLDDPTLKADVSG
jgi:hypothetical protein